MQIKAKYTNRETGQTGQVSVEFDPTSPPSRLPVCTDFVFGSDSHPQDFRCQNCDHFAWSEHAPAEAWVGASDAPARLALAAMEAVLADGAASEVMLTTLRAWAWEFLGGPIASGDKAIIDLFMNFSGV